MWKVKKQNSYFKKKHSFFKKISFTNNNYILQNTFIVLCSIFTVHYNSYANVVSHWQLNETSGTTAADVLNTNNGTLINGPLWTSGKRNGGLEFDGVNDYVNCGNDVSLNITQQITIMAWVKGSGDGKIVNKSRRNYTHGDYDLSKSRFVIYVDNGGYPNGYKKLTFNSPDNEWAHIVATYDGDWMRVYVNGKLVGNSQIGSHTIDTSGGNLGIGANLRSDNPGANPFLGKIDDVRIYNHALSQEEITEAFSLVSHWQLNETSGTTAADVLNTNNGTLINGPLWTSGKRNGGLEFDGVNDYVNCGNDVSLNITQQITIMAWVKGSGDGKIVNKSRRNYTHGDYDLSKESFALYFDNEGYPNGYEKITFNSPDNEWVHIAATYDGDFLTVYINGCRAARRQIGYHVIDTSGGDLGLGANLRSDNPGANPFSGIIDDVRIYDYALQPGEIASIAGRADAVVDVREFSGAYFTSVIVSSMTSAIILPDDNYISGEVNNELNIKAAPGEFEPGSFVLHALSNQQTVVLEVTDLDKIGSTEKITASNVDVKIVKCWYQSGYGSGGADMTHKHLTPELLLNDDFLVKVENEQNYLKVSGQYIIISDPAGIPNIPNKPTVTDFPIQDATSLQPFNLVAGKNKQFLVTVKIPNTASPGYYSGTISLKVSGQLIGTINLNIEVLDINLVNSDFISSIYYRSTVSNTGTISGEQKNSFQYAAELQNMYNHGIINPTCCQPIATISSALNLRDAANMLNGQVLYYQGGLFKNDNINELKTAVSNLINTASAYGVTTVYIYGKDEEDMNNPVDRAKIAAIHDVGGKVFAAQNYTQASGVADVLDLAVVSSLPDSALAATYHSYGNKIVNYANPQGVIENPDVFRRNYGLLLWRNNYDGILYWPYQCGYWNDFMPYGIYRGFIFAYPTANGVINTMQWEGLREGIDDVRYIKVLEQRIAANPGNPIAGQAALYLQNLDVKRNLDVIRSEIIAYILQLP